MFAPPPLQLTPAHCNISYGEIPCVIPLAPSYPILLILTVVCGVWLVGEKKMVACNRHLVYVAVNLFDIFLLIYVILALSYSHALKLLRYYWPIIITCLQLTWPMLASFTQHLIQFGLNSFRFTMPLQHVHLALRTNSPDC